uniref:Kazal-like domain-containing protein n=1 Tax=Graphocephala atropunctata TaxID=36148 RepID=A0A1B6MVK4_9HEMI
MMILTLLCAAVLAVLVDCRPQEFVFPEGTARPSRFPLRPGEPQFRPTRPLPPRRTTQFTQQNSEMTPTTPPSTNSNTTTRIPPRDPANRIVYIVSCPCKFTYQYNPVCGTDGQTYGNMGVLQCAKQCGTQVDVYLEGACGRNNG